MPHKFWTIIIGVIVAFALDSWYQRRVNENTREKYLSMIGHEVGISVKRLQPPPNFKRQLLPDDRWKSLVNSGDLKLFCADQANEMADAYHGVSNYNYQAIRVRDSAELIRAETDRMLLGAAGVSWKVNDTELENMRASLLQSLSGLQSRKWFMQ